MKLEDIPEVFREAIAVHLILMGGAGVPSDHIFVSPHGIAPDGSKGHLAVIIEQGDFKFSITVGRVGMCDDDFYELWPEAVRLVHLMSDKEAKELRESTFMHTMAAKILAAIKVKRMTYLQHSKHAKA